MTQAAKITQELKENKQQAPAKKKENQTLQTMLEKMKPEFKKALPQHMSEERMVRLLMTALRNNPQLQNADPMTFLAAAMEAAQYGLEPNTSMGECYIVPRKIKGKQVAQLQLGYKGILKLAYNTNQYKAIYAHPVYANDEFNFQYGLNKDLVHIPSDEQEGEPTHYYAVYHLKNGGFDFRVMSTDVIREHARKHSDGFNSNYSPWKTNFDSMAMKTVLRRVLKYAPMATDLNNALQADGTTKTELNEDMSQVIDMEYKELEAKEEVESYNASSDKNK